MSNVVHTNIIRKCQGSSIGYGKDKSHFKYIIGEGYCALYYHKDT